MFLRNRIARLEHIAPDGARKLRGPHRYKHRPPPEGRQQSPKSGECHLAAIQISKPSISSFSQLMSIGLVTYASKPESLASERKSVS